MSSNVAFKHVNLRTTANLALFAVATTICLWLCELGTRWLLGNQIMLIPRFHTSAQYGEFTIRRLRPNSEFWHTDPDGSWKFVTNSQGFRSNVDYEISKPWGVFRVIALGDSTTEGFEVRQNYTYPEVLQRYLRKNGLNAEVFNTGVSGFGTAEELIYLENEGIKFNPDVVVLGFFGNDFDDNVRSDLFRMEDGELVTANRTYIPGVAILDVINSVPLLRWLSQNSYLYSLVANTVWDAAKRARLNANEQARETEFTIATSPNKYKTDLTLALLERLYAFCKLRSIPLVIVDIPQASEPQLTPSIPADLQSQFRKNSDALILSEDLFSPYVGLAELHALHGVGHPNEFSNAMIALAVGERIRQLESGCAGGQQADPCPAARGGTPP